MRLFAVSIALGLLCFAPSGLCQTVGAKQHFAAGVKHAENGDFRSALREFEEAYAIRPHFSVLFNIAQAHAALGDPIQAQQAFERYLAEGGKAISEARREQVRAMLAQQRARVGAVQISGLQPGMRVWVDGREIEPTALAQPIQLVAGLHSVISSLGTGFPTNDQVEVQSGKLTQYEPSLPVTPRAMPSPPPGTLKANCQVPGVNVHIDGQFAFMTPDARGVETAVGRRTVVFSRPGYMTTERTVLVSAGEPTTVNCDIYPLASIPADTAAHLTVRTDPSDARVLLDGRRWRESLVPSGTHTLRVEREGFVPQERVIIAPAGKTVRIPVLLNPTEATQRARAEAKRRRFLAYSAGAGGLVFAIAGGVTLAWNGHRYDDWRATRATASPGEQLETVASVQRADDLAFGAIAVGAGLLVTSTWLWLSSGSPAE